MLDHTSNIQIIPPGVTKWNGRTVLTAHGCALLERFTGKSYTYHVVNMQIGNSAHICHKSKPIPEDEREAMIMRFLQAGQGLTDDSFTHIKLSMGLDKLKPIKIMESSRQSPFNYQENALTRLHSHIALYRQSVRRQLS